MNSVWRIVSLIAVVAWATAQPAQQPKQDQKKGRDLKYEENNTAPAPAVAVPRGYALIVGIANYKNLPAKSQLEFSERDADAIYSILISPEGGNFRAENVHRLSGAQATMANLKRELETWLPSVAKEDDRVVIYFAGHGFISAGRAYLAPYDLDPANIPGTGYPMDTLGQVAGSRIKAKWKVLLTDACHSGAIAPDAEAQALNQSLLDMSRSMFSLTASRDRERSFESQDWGGGHGIFTYYVVKGLEGEADESGDGIVTADELANYVRRNVREATKGQQNPTSDRGSFDPNMLLAFLPNGLRVAHQPPPVDGTLIFESNMDGVEVFVDGTSRGFAGKGAPLRLPGMRPGSHAIQGVKMGYEPDGPRDEVVYPGRDSTVTIKISIARRRTKAALDELNDGLAFYNKGSADNYKKAAGHFEKALQIDATYSQAALYLGRAYNSLFDEQRSEAALRQAIAIDPDYLEARVSLAGMLLDTGAVDESIRQLNLVTQRDRSNAVALYMQAQAYRMKDLYPQAIESARASIKLAPAAAEPHLWLAESLRLSSQFAESSYEYTEYLRLSDYDSKFAGKMNYYVLGFLAGVGRKKRAAQTDTWRDMRSLAYFGLCDSERKQGRFELGVAYCQKSLAYDANDAYTHYALALCYAREAAANGSLETLAAARKHFQTMIDLNGDLEEAKFARQNLQNIDTLLKTR
ncbi:MAG: caspase family protein [Acidobacteriota bacterium]|nr:caspase family protein [Acidobacteriota bacterium]